MTIFESVTTQPRVQSADRRHVRARFDIPRLCYPALDDAIPGDAVPSDGGGFGSYRS